MILFHHLYDQQCNTLYSTFDSCSSIPDTITSLSHLRLRRILQHRYKPAGGGALPGPGFGGNERLSFTDSIVQ